MSESDPQSSLRERLRRQAVSVGQGQLLQQRIENVHLVVAIGILGWYVTGHQDEIVNLGLGTDGFFFAIAVIAGIFVGAKVNTITLRMTSFGGSYIRVLDEFVLPFFFFVSLDGLIITFVFYAVYSELGLSVSQTVVASTIVLVTVVISYRMAVAWNRYTNDLRDQDMAFEQRIAELQSSKLERVLFDNPDLIEEGFQSFVLQWRDRINGFIIAADLFGIDSDGLDTVVEVKTNVDASAVEEFRSSVVERVEGMRTVIAGFSITEEAQDLIEGTDIEFIQLDREAVHEAVELAEEEFVG